MRQIFGSSVPKLVLCAVAMPWTGCSGERPIDSTDQGAVANQVVAAHSGGAQPDNGFRETRATTVESRNELPLDRHVRQRTRPMGIPLPNPDLERAVRDDDWGTIEAMLVQGTDLTGMTEDGRSLVHVAAESPCPRAAMLLLRAGADPDCLSLDGETPLDVLRRRGFVLESATDQSFDEVLLQRMKNGIERAFELARESLDRGQELAELRCSMIAEFEVDRARFKERAALFSSRVIGVETPLPMRLWDVPTDERPPGWVANYKTTDTTPQAYLKTEAVPLPRDFDSPLDLPIPPPFDQAVELVHIAVLEAGFAFGVRHPAFRRVVERAKAVVREAEVGKRQ